MKITKSQLKQIIKEEINELFGFGKKKKPEPYTIGPEPVAPQKPELTSAERHALQVKQGEARRSAKKKAKIDKYTEEIQKKYGGEDCQGLKKALAAMEEQQRRNIDSEREQYSSQMGSLRGTGSGLSGEALEDISIRDQVYVEVLAGLLQSKGCLDL